MSALSPKEILLQEAAAAASDPPAQRARGISFTTSSFYGRFSGSATPKPIVPVEIIPKVEDKIKVSRDSSITENITTLADDENNRFSDDDESNSEKEEEDDDTEDDEQESEDEDSHK